MSLFDDLRDTVSRYRLPPHVAARLDVAEQALVREDVARVEKELVSLREALPDDPRVRFLDAWVAEQKGDYERSDALAKELPEDQADADTLRLRARAALRGGDAERAVPLLRRALRSSSCARGREEARLLLAEALLSLGEAEEARRELGPLLFAEEEAGGESAAQESSRERAAEAVRRDALRLAVRAGLALGEEAPPSLGDELLELCALEPEVPENRLQLARWYRIQGRATDALPLYEAIAADEELEPAPRIAALVGLASLLRGAGQPAQAFERWEAAVAMGADPAPFALEAGRAALALEAPERAMAWLDARLAEAPESAEALALKARLLLLQGEVEGARALLSPLRGVRMIPDVLIGLARLSLRSGDPVEALSLLREAEAVGAWEDAAPLLEEALLALRPTLPSLDALQEAEPASLVQLLEALAPVVAEHPLLTSLLPRLTGLRRQLDAPLTVAIVGEFNAGKSTLINAFLGEEVLATGVLPTTSHVNRIRYGPRPVARWTDPQERIREIPFREAATLVKQRPEEIAALEFCHPHPELRSIHFWDSPGFNAPEEVHEERASRALSTADAIVWVLDASQALSASQLDQLDRVRDPQERLLVVINKVDRLGGDAEALERVRAHVEAHLPGGVAGLFSVSTLAAFRRRSAADQERAPAQDATDESWDAFETALRERFFERAGRLKALEAAAGLTVLSDAALERVREARAGVATERAALHALRQDVQEAEARWVPAHLVPARRVLEGRLVEERERLAKEVVELVGTRSTLLARRQLAGPDRRFLEERLRRRLRAAAEATWHALREGCRGLEARMVARIEEIAERLPPADARTLRRRLDAWLSEVRAAHDLLAERVVATPMALAEERIARHGDAALEGAAPGVFRDEEERAAALEPLLPPRDDLRLERLEAWSTAYHAAARRLCEHVERDLDLVDLDLQHHVEQPFRELRAALGGEAETAETAATAEPVEPEAQTHGPDAPPGEGA